MLKKYTAAAAALAAIMLLGAHNAQDNAHQNAFFATALAEAGIPTLGLSLEAKKLAYAQALAQRNPLLALPGTDLDQLDSDIGELVELKTQTYEINAGSKDAELLHTLYQTDFLSALSWLERTRRAFAASGSKQDSAVYSAAAKRAFAAYQSDAAAFKAAFALAVPEGAGKFATDGDIIGRDDILLALERLMEGSRAIAGTFAARERCVRGVTHACRASDLETPVMPVSEEVEVTQRQLVQAKAVRALSAKAHEQPKIAEDPMLLLPSTRCARNMGGGAPLFAFFTPASLGDARAPFPTYIGDIRFNTTEQSASPSFERFSDAMREQVTYVLNPPMLHYHCLRMAHDSGKLFAMRDTYALALAQGLSVYATSSEDKASLAALEKKDLEILTQHQVERYLATASTLPLPAQQKSQVRELRLTYQLSSANFDANLGEILADQESNIALIKKGWPIDMDVPFMFFTRSAFAMLLLADNRSATGLAGDATERLFPPNDIPKEKQPFVYYSDLPHMPAMIQRLIHDINFFYMIHVDPSLIDDLI